MRRLGFASCFLCVACSGPARFWPASTVKLLSSLFVALATAADYADKLITLRAFSTGSLSAVRNVVLSAPK